MISATKKIEQFRKIQNKRTVIAHFVNNFIPKNVAFHGEEIQKMKKLHKDLSD